MDPILRVIRDYLPSNPVRDIHDISRMVSRWSSRGGHVLWTEGISSGSFSAGGAPATFVRWGVGEGYTVSVHRVRPGAAPSHGFCGPLAYLPQDWVGHYWDGVPVTAGEYEALRSAPFQSPTALPLPPRGTGHAWAVRLAHLAPAGESGDRISYFARRAHIALGRRTEGRTGRVLRRLFPTATDAEITDAVAEWKATYGDIPLEFARTREEIREAYERGPTSCMSGGARAFDTPPGVHPAEVYAAGDLAVAYVRDRHGEISGRALCHPASGTYGPVYGERERLVAALERADFRKDDGGAMVGARLLRIDAGPGKVVMPYLDGYSVGESYDGSLSLAGAHSGWDGQNTNGVCYTAHMYSCDDCGSATPEDDLVEGVCEDCRANYYFSCDGCGGLVHHDCTEHDGIHTEDGCVYCIDCAADYLHSEEEEEEDGDK